MINSNRCGKPLDKIQHPFIIKTLKAGIKKMPQHNKGIYMTSLQLTSYSAVKN